MPKAAVLDTTVEYGTNTSIQLRVLMEKLDPLTPLQKSDLKHGDSVSLQYSGKIFDGVIDFVSLPLSLQKEMCLIR